MVLVAAFFVTAIFYASVGFGGGSTYNALLALSGVDYQLLPAIALVCNIIVVVGGTLRFARAGLVPWRQVLPLALISAPFAWLGGLTPVKESVFLSLLAMSLMIAGISLLLQKEQKIAQDIAARSFRDRWFDPLVAIGVGYLAGLVGIGGGVFLAPYLHFTRWAQSRQIAAAASVFILINSVAGLTGQFMKLGTSGKLASLADHWPLAVAVLIGGQIGSIMGISLLSPLVVRRATALLVLFVAGQLVWKLLG
jgi:uncharacterized protein